jgi:hypothetical protein
VKRKTAARTFRGHLLSVANALATYAFAYFSLNQQLPPIAEALLDKIPQPWQTVVRAALPIAWGTFIQFCKSWSNRHAVAAANPDPSLVGTPSA